MAWKMSRLQDSSFEQPHSFKRTILPVQAKITINMTNLFHHIYAAPSPNSLTFNVPEQNSLSTHPQVFEYSAIYRHIATQGIMQARRFVLHPITRASVRCDVALSLVKDVNDETQGIINNERLCIGLTLEDENPLTQSDYELYNQTLSSIQSR